MNTGWKEVQAAVEEGWCINTEMSELVKIRVQYHFIMYNE